jgi:ZIP family zinc transporter
VSAVAEKTPARVAAALLPLALLVGLVAFLLTLGPAGLFGQEFPPVEDLTVDRVTLTEGEITMVVTNGGPDPVTISQVLVDEAYWQHEVTPERTLDRLDTGTVTIPYPWIEGEAHEIVLISASGVTFSHGIEVAVESPSVDGRFLVTFALLGVYIGVVPVLLGMTWMPFLRTLSRRWIHFFMAFTAGILIFLGVETLVEAIEQSEGLPSALGGIGVVTVGALGAFLLILLGSRRLQASGAADRRLLVAYAVAAGIGLHNLGEGLAVGAAYRLGEVALGAFLVIGFAIHNTTEGLGIVSILGERKTAIRTLLVLGLIAGVPTIFGAWTGAFVFSTLVATIFLGIAAGAIAEVVYDVMKVVSDESDQGLLSVESLAGIVVGLVVMYLTGLLVTA